MVLVLITITMFLQLQFKACVGCVESERVGLLELKSYINSFLISEKLSVLESWSDDDDDHSDCCFWNRVKCNNADGGRGHIVHLSWDDIFNDISTYSLQELPHVFEYPLWSLNLSLLHSFPQLQTLNLSMTNLNHLFDPIHGYKSFQRLEKLRILDLSDNNLNNSDLPFLSAARSLTTLNLASNRLEGVFPPNEQLTNMTKLKVLNLEHNGFTFFSNKGLEHLVELEVLSLASNKFNHTGFIHQVFKNMLKLQELDLSYSEFTAIDLVLPSSLQVLNLGGNQLSLTPKGYLEICRLSDLRELGLWDNALTSMPDCLGNLTRLRTLDLSDNQLNGDLSFFVSGLPSALEYLSLYDNNFNGSFLFNSLVNQTRLKVLLLTSAVGTIQAQAERSWVPQFQLEILTLQNFNFGSTIPGFLVHQHDFFLVDLSNNKLTGAFPAWLVQNSTRLQVLLLNNNLLTELQLPRLVHSLRRLDISSNMIYDSIQQDIGNVFPNLEFMNLSSNHFHGTIPSSMGEMKSLELLDMSSNGLSGQLPKSFVSGCYSLGYLKLSDNQFWGEIFSEHANLTALGYLFLDGNNFNGSLGKGLLNSEYLSFLDISDNRISGALPLWIGRMSRLKYLYMKGNHLKGSFPRQLQNLTVIDISHNSFSGPLLRKLDFPDLQQLRLQSNEFTGTIPDTLFKAKSLEVLDLGNNNFSGKILNNIGNSSTLGVLLLQNNSLEGHIPERICQVLSKVSILDLSHNKFKGVIPSCFSNMSFGAQGYLGIGIFTQTSDSLKMHNWSYSSALGLDGYIRVPFDGEPSPTTIVDFLTKSRYETYQGSVLYMYGLDLSSNQLSGEIPAEIGNLVNIKSLNFSSNHLTGPIPYRFSKLKELESLDLSNNKLDGKIPPQLADLNSLGYFDVSHNNLSGEIPFKGHLGSFDEKSYIGNARLCGLPTNISCNPTRTPEPKEEEKEEDGDGVIDMMWFYWTCGAVYITTVLALFAFLCIDSRWSQGWFYSVDLFIHHLQRFKARFLCN